MTNKIKTGIAYHKDYLKQDIKNHPECKERLIAIMNAIEKNEINKNIINIFNNSLNQIIDIKTIINQIELVHDPNYIKYIQKLSDKGGGILDSDTIISQDTYDVLFSYYHLKKYRQLFQAKFHILFGWKLTFQT